MAGGFRSFKSEKQRKKVMSILDERYGGGLKLQGQQNAVRILEERHPTTNIVVTKKRREAVLDKLRKPYLVMSDDEVQHIKNSLNRMEYGKPDNAEYAEQANDLIASHPNGVRLNEELTKKGLEYLTRSAIYNSLGTRERDVVDNFKEFKFEGFYNDDNGYRSYYIPEWRVIANNGNYFTYVGKGSREIEVTG